MCCIPESAAQLFNKLEDTEEAMPPMSISVSPVLPFDPERNLESFECNVEKVEPKKINVEYVSPIKALALNFRFNQLFGTFPALISDDWFHIRIIKKGLILWFAVRAIFTTTILGLTYIWLQEQVMILLPKFIISKVQVIFFHVIFI